MKKYGVILSISALLAAGCATSKSVDQKIAEAQAQTAQKLESVVGQVEDLQEKQTATDLRLDELSKEAREALQRAKDAGVLAQGKVIFEQSFSEDRIKFRLESYELSDDAKKALDEFAGRVKATKEQFFVEIQGHTDDTGTQRYNDELGQRRAEAVRRYLSRQHGLPLNRMSTISYGDTSPVESNKTNKGRSANRRVVIVVLA